jgi:Flp pilus assembly protein TadG
MIVNSSKNKRGRRGQALVEFSLALTILLFLIFGILEFGRVLFAYSSASDSLRSALRNATVLGVEEGSSLRPYLDCNDMQAVAQNNFFTGTQTITIRYQKTDGSGLFYSCNGVGDPQVSDSVLNNGDLLVIDLGCPPCKHATRRGAPP